MDELRFRETLRLTYNMIARAFDTSDLADPEVQQQLIDMLQQKVDSLCSEA